MQTPEMTLRIEMFGNLIEELNYWHNACGDEEQDENLQYCEDRFIDALEAVRDLRQALLEDLQGYLYECRSNSVPIDISYYRIKKQLEESTFELVK
jgi:hypothetical protein